MALTVLLGGARSGKSSAAQSLAAALDRPVTYVATATAGDDEMTARIQRHRRDRPSNWSTIEEPLLLDKIIAGCEDGETVIIDCLTLWVTNLTLSGVSEADVLAIAATAAAAAAQRQGSTIAVTNEVGMGVVPPTPMGREFRDLAGRVNRLWVDLSARAAFVVAGRVLPLQELAEWGGAASDR